MGGISGIGEQTRNLEAGARDKRATVQQRTDADARGQSGLPVPEWADLFTGWASKRNYSGQESDQAEQVVGTYDSAFTFAYRADIDPDVFDVQKLRRIVYLGRVYDIVAGGLIGRREGVELLTVSGGLL